MSSNSETPTNNAGKDAIKEWPTAAQPAAIVTNAERRARQIAFAAATPVYPPANPGPAAGPQGGKRKTHRKMKKTLRNKNKRTRKH